VPLTCSNAGVSEALHGGVNRRHIHGKDALTCA
jgi:hypothetical protein